MEVPEGKQNGSYFADTQRVSQAYRCSVEPPSEMVSLFLGQDTSIN